MEEAGIPLTEAARVTLAADKDDAVEVSIVEDTTQYFERFASVRRLVAPALIRKLAVKQNETLSSITRRTRVRYAAELARYLVYTIASCTVRMWKTTLLWGCVRMQCTVWW